MALSTRRSGRTRFTILLLVLTAITLLTLDGRGFGPIDSARSAILSVLSPVGDAAAAVFRPIGNAWSSAFDQGDLQAENDRLREENDRLQGEVSAGQVSQEQLQQLLENEGITFTGDIPRAHAQVVAGSVGNFGTTLDLDKGSSSGIAVDMAVVTGKGLIGKVVQVSENRCTVELITSGNYNVGFNVVGTPAVGVAQGTESTERAARHQHRRLGQLERRARQHRGHRRHPSQLVPAQPARSARWPPSRPTTPPAQTTVDITMFARTTDLTYADVVLWQQPAP